MIILDPTALEPHADPPLMIRTPAGIACPREGECNTSTDLRARPRHTLFSLRAAAGPNSQIWGAGPRSS